MRLLEGDTVTRTIVIHVHSAGPAVLFTVQRNEINEIIEIDIYDSSWGWVIL